jgi:hypothetical protein
MSHCHISTTETKDNTKKRRKYVYCILFVLLIILFGKGCLCSIISSVAGYSETGHPQSVDEIPLCLAGISSFATQWPIHYNYSANTYRMMGYSICGYSTLDQMKSACKKLSLDLQQWNERKAEYKFFRLEEINKQFQDDLECIPADERDAFEKGECTSEDYIFSGTDSNGNNIYIGYFRPRDGYYAILGNNHAYHLSEAKGIRTVYVPGIGRIKDSFIPTHRATRPPAAVNR